MRWLDKIRNRSTRYDVTDTSTGQSQTFFVEAGLAPSWGASSFSEGMAVPAAWRATLLVSDALGSLPWHAYRDRAGRPTELVTPTPALLEQPAPPATRMETFSAWFIDLLHNGNAIGIIADRNAEGYPTAVLPVPTEAVQIRRNPTTGRVEYAVGYAADRPALEQTIFDEDDVIHVKGPCRPGDLRGMGVLEMHASTLGLAREQSRQAASLSRNGVPTGLLKSENPDLTPEEAADLKAGWLRSQQQRTVAVLNSTTTFQPLGWDAEKTQLVESRKFSLQEIALIFGVPGYFLGAEGASMTYSNVEHEGINFTRWGLGGHIARFEQTLSQHMPRGTRVKVNLDGLLRADTTTRYQAHATALGAGFLTIDEVRGLEDLPPLPTADDKENNDDE